MTRRLILDSGAFRRRDCKRFRAKYTPGDENKCWPWQAGMSDGYGEFWFDGRMHKANRIAYLMYYGGKLKDGIQVLHTCDNPKCVNPHHLFKGTHATNMEDKAAKGRASRLKGQNNPWSKLTDADVIRMRRLYKTKRYLQKDLAKMFGLKDVGHVSHILLGKGYSHLNEIEPPVEPWQGPTGRKRKGVSR